MMKLRKLLRLEDQLDGLRTSSREDGLSMPESKDHSRIELEKEKLDQRSLNSETKVTMICKILLKE
jgi:hypothetical protein